MTAPTGIVNVHAAKTQLSKLLERAEAGEEIVIGRAGKPIAKLVPYVPDRPRRVFGALKGQVRILPGFDDLDDEVTRDFEDSIARPIEP
jgi:prevent-host-death family protein